MEITDNELNKVTKLAKLGLTEQEKTSLKKDLTNIINMIEELQEVNTDNIESMTNSVRSKLPMREDVVNDGNYAEDIVANSPSKEYKELNCFVVPKVVE